MLLCNEVTFLSLSLCRKCTIRMLLRPQSTCKRCYQLLRPRTTCPKIELPNMVTVLWYNGRCRLDKARQDKTVQLKVILRPSSEAKMVHLPALAVPVAKVDLSEIYDPDASYLSVNLKPIASAASFPTKSTHRRFPKKCRTIAAPHYLPSA